ncbi:MAG: MerR family transcriptional regulator [Desulfovibrionaceae bacterium]
MAQQFISLREVGRQLGIPPSTVVYYKDRFAAYIPAQGGEGRRRRYPLEVLDIFRRIREMFENNWSAEQIEQELSQGAARGARVGGRLAADAPLGARLAPERREYPLDGPAGGLGDGGLGDVLVKITDLLENQTLFRGEIRSLRDEVAGLREERDRAERRHAERVDHLQREVEALRRAKLDLERLVRAGAAGGASATASGLVPADEFLSRPLVIRSVQGEYLGVLGVGKKHFSLADFVEIMERNISTSRRIETAWERRDGAWVLLITARDTAKDAVQRIVLVAGETVTPNRNVVVEIRRLNIDGTDVPDALLLNLFRQVKDEFAAG